MGLLYLLFNFGLHCLHILAWPILALGYPLCASIRAIEANSDLDTRKLITYWVCLSLILLLDHAFYLLPNWHFVKLIIVGCLVIPCFDGSFYIYNHLVRPILSVNPRIVLNWLVKVLEIILKEDTPLNDEVKREAKETEPQALQKLIALKGTVEQPEYERKDVIAEEIKEKNELSETNLVTRAEPLFAMPEKRDLYDLLACNTKPQNEWTCAACQVTATSEADLISHLRGKRHTDVFNKVKPKELGNVSLPNSSQNTAETPWTCVLCKVKCPEKTHLISHFLGQRHTKALASLKAKPEAKFFFKPWTCELCNTQLKNRNDLILHLESKRHLAACGNPKIETKWSIQDEVSSASSENDSNLAKWKPKEVKKPKGEPAFEIKDDRKLWCSICGVSCTGKENMNQHFKGKKHLARATELSGGGAAAAVFG